jgi:hypothetical protein
MTGTDVRERVVAQITACWPTQAIFVGVRLRLFDKLADGPRAAADLAAETEAHPGAVRRLLRGLATLDLCRQLDRDRFELTEAGRLLCASTPGGVRGMALHWGDRLWGALSQLEHSVRTGEPWSASGQAGFELMASDPDQMAMFHQSMAEQSTPVARAMLEAYDFSRFTRLVDVGGGYGAMLATVLKAHPGQIGQVYDLADLGPAAQLYLQASGVGSRAGFVGGDFFETVPTGADAYMLKSIIHDWADEPSRRILANCRKALGPGGVVLVIERVAPEVASGRPEELDALRQDLIMLTATGGQERAVVEYEALFADAGLRLAGVTPTSSGFSILEAAAA